MPTRSRFAPRAKPRKRWTSRWTSSTPTIDALILHQVELPAFSTLDNIAEQIQTRTQSALFRCVARRLSDEERQRLDRLPTREFTNRLTAYNNIKRHARRPSRKHLSLLIEHLTLLDGLGDFS